MKIGCCVKDASEAKLAREAGFDFVECSVLSLLPEEEEAAFQEVFNSYRECSIPVEVCNLFLPRDMQVVGDTVDYERINKYVVSALRRVKTIGADTIVFGSGYARNYPCGFSREKAEEQIVDFLQIVAGHAEKLDVTIVIEPLNRQESNMINSIAEAVYFAQKIHHRSIQVLADFYHMDEEREPLTKLIRHGAYLKHVHLADTGRRQPGTGLYPYPEFARCLKEAKYNGRICIEAVWTDFKLHELKNSLHFLQSHFI